jgi:hypothetical protein
MRIIWPIATVLLDYITALAVATMFTLATGFSEVTSLHVAIEWLA